MKLARRIKAGVPVQGEGVPRVPIDEARDVAASDGMPILALDQALDRLVLNVSP